MDNFLTQHFLSMKWDKDNYFANVTDVNEENVISVLDSSLPEWSFETNNLVVLNNQPLFSITVYFPGRIFSSSGRSEADALINIIKKVSVKNNISSLQNPIEKSVKELQSESRPKETKESVLQRLEEVKNNVQNKQKTNTDDIFEDLLSEPVSSQSVQQQNNMSVEQNVVNSEPEYVEFGSPESNAFEQQFMQNVEQSQKERIVQPTAEIVNPTGQPIPKSAWTNEMADKLKLWMGKHNVTSKDQMSAWFIKYCGLDYDYFDPKFVDNFIAWTEELREKQTY